MARWIGRTGAPSARCSRGLPDVVTGAQFLADGHTVLISSVAGTISSWDTRPQRAVEVACDIAGRNLTREEWLDALPTRPYHETCPTAMMSRIDRKPTPNGRRRSL